MSKMDRVIYTNKIIRFYWNIRTFFSFSQQIWKKNENQQKKKIATWNYIAIRPNYFTGATTQNNGALHRNVLYNEILHNDTQFNF